VARANAWRKPGNAALQQALASRAEHPDALVREHVAWALSQRSD